MSPTRAGFARQYGPWAVVTGASDGIGMMFARELAAHGIHLVLVARRADRLAAVAAELHTAFGIETRIVPADLGNKASARSMLEATEDLQVGLLVAAAGFGSSGPALYTEDDNEAVQVEVNCTAVLLQCLHFGRRMAARRQGGMILFSSVLAFQGTPWSANYAATKAYVQALAEGLAEELAPDGVDVLCVAPGPTMSGFSARANMQLGRTTPADVVARVSLSALGKRRTVRPGWLSKLLGWGLGTAPRPLRVRIIGRIMASMTNHQRARALPCAASTTQPDAIDHSLH